MGTYLKAEKLKYRHTFLWGLMIFMPVACTLLSALLTYEYFAMDGYNWWYMLLLPGLLSVVCGQIGGKDLKKKNHTIGVLPADMGKIWDAKLFLAAAVSGIATLTLMLLVFTGSAAMKEGFSMILRNQPSLGQQLLAAVLIWLTSLWQLPLCLFLVQKAGVLLMVVMNLAVSQIVGPLLSVKGCFFLIPYGITPRVMCPVLKILPNGLPAEPGQITYTPELMSIPRAAAGCVVSLLWFAALWYFTRKWFQRKVEDSWED